MKIMNNKLLILEKEMDSINTESLELGSGSLKKYSFMEDQPKNLFSNQE